jgi:hypothetical protein
MGVVIPGGGFSEDRASGAQIVDGSLRFDSAKSQYLKWTPSSAGNRSTWTFSGWYKRNLLDTGSVWTNLFTAATGGSNYSSVGGYLNLADDFGVIDYISSSIVTMVSTNSLQRDISSWYHIVAAYDTTNSTSTDRIKIYINGVRQTSIYSGRVYYPSQNYASGLINSANQHSISEKIGYYGNGQYSQFYFIDGQALDPSYFGYTDSLTNTWRPKKLSSSVAFGTNGFYLPFDGSAPIGQDQSGRGNNWTPVNFGGSNTIEKATGALPILNTDGGGKVARVGVRTDNNPVGVNTFCTVALPLVGITSDFSNQVSGGVSNNKAVTVTSAVGVTTESNFYGGSYVLGNGKYLDLTGPSVGATEDYTIEFWIKLKSSASYANIMPGYWGNIEFYWSIQNVNSSDGQSVLNKFRVEDGAGGMDSNNVKNDYDISASVASSWNHLAFVRSNTNCYLYLNGIRQTLHGATTDSSTKSGTLRIGHTSNGEYYLNDFRLYKGVAKYTSNFIPASTDPDIVPDSPSGVSYSSNVALVPSTDGAVSFDGSNSYLSSSVSTDLQLSSSDFTIEAFINWNSFSGAKTAVQFSDGTDAYSMLFGYPSGTAPLVYISSTGSSWDIANGVSFGVTALNKWTHYALTRSSSTFRMFVDGVLVNTFTSSSSIYQATNQVTLGRGQTSAGGSYFNGFISNFHVVKGTALYTANFTPPSAPISSVANTKLLCCKSQTSATAADVAPGTITANGNAAASNFNPFTVNINTQRGKQSGYCTLNPLKKGSLITLSDGNLKWSSSGSGYGQVHGTIGMSSGKWYWECMNLTGGLSAYGAGVVLESASSLESEPGGDANSWAWLFRSSGGNSKYNNGSITTYGNQSVSTSDVVGVTFNADTGDLTFYVNGVSQGTAFTLTTGRTYLPLAGDPNSSTNTEGNINFGQKPFKFPPPAGFQPLTLANTPRPTIVRPDQYVGVTTYTGNGGTQSINVGFQPDFVWIKNRTDASTNNSLFDSVRGAGISTSNSRRLSSDNTNAEFTSGDQYGYLSSFDPYGFSISKGTASPDNTNGSAKNYVAWAWKAGGNSNTFNIDGNGYSTASAAGLTAGTITPTGASVNTKSGFSIIAYTGTGASASISHGLGKAPAFIIIKKRTSSPGATNWRVYHSGIGNTKALFLSTTGAEDTNSVYWNNTSPTSSVFTLGTDDGLNASSQTHIAYLWAEIPGFSKFGSYTGNGADLFVYTGFRPKWLLIKNTGQSNDWFLMDSERAKYNPIGTYIYPNTSGAEPAVYNWIDFLSNGFRVLNTGTGNNNSTVVQIYAAFAESPTFNLYGAQANAR